MNASIQFNNVSLSYGDITDEVEVLKSISFSIGS